VILVLAGTQDGREIAAGLREAGYEVIASVVSEYGRELAAQSGVPVQASAMDEHELQQFVIQHGIRLMIDATHPYAVNVSRNASQVAAKLHIPCLRYERPDSALPIYAKLVLAPDMQRAAEMAVGLGKTVFLTTGSHSLPLFRAAAAGRDCRLIARVLPQPEVIADCIANGFSPADIIAAQGPFSQELNRELFRAYGADVMVTKNSGAIGGTDAKIAAAIELGLVIVVVQRPAALKQQVFESLSALLEYLKRK
jgi:precorrin-6A/cobalt-precorrin-6A reductase